MRNFRIFSSSDHLTAYKLMLTTSCDYRPSENPKAKQCYGQEITMEIEKMGNTINKYFSAVE